MRRLLGIAWLAGLAACAGAPDRRGSDTAGPATAAPDSTEPDFITDADTLGPQPVEPAFRLLGNEPFWNLTIDSTGLRFRTPEDTAGLRFGFTRAVAVGDSLRWNSVGDAGRIEAIVAPATCSDGMSDRVWLYRARVTIGTRRYTGCAERR
jgi:uncharacterized membrane protein